MKKQIIAFALLSTLVSFPLFAQSPLAEKFSNLSREIVTSSVRPFDRLEKLKTIFTDCSLKNKNPEIKSACAEWLSGTYQEIKEATPEQIYVELGSGDVEVKKIGEKSFFPGPGAQKNEIGDEYELHIPKYHFIYRFPIAKGKEYREALKEWKWDKNGMIVIPNPFVGEGFGKDKEDNILIFFNTPHLNEKSSLSEVGKSYKSVFEYIYYMKDLDLYSKYYKEAFLAKIADNTSSKKKISSKAEEELNYKIYGGPLPAISGSDSKFGISTLNQICRYDESMSPRHAEEIARGRKPNKNCEQIQKIRRGSDIWFPRIIRDINNPKIISVELYFNRKGDLVFYK